jgi:hypothetical protein
MDHGCKIKSLNSLGNSNHLTIVFVENPIKKVTSAVTIKTATLIAISFSAELRRAY